MQVIRQTAAMAAMVALVLFGAPHAMASQSNLAFRKRYCGPGIS